MPASSSKSRPDLSLLNNATYQPPVTRSNAHGNRTAPSRWPANVPSTWKIESEFNGLREREADPPAANSKAPGKFSDLLVVTTIFIILTALTTSGIILLWG